MKTTSLRAACALITGLLIASVSALAQTAPPSPAEFSSPPADTSLVLPSSNPKLNFFVEVGALYCDTKLGDQYRAKDSSNLYGIGVVAGYRLNAWHRFALDAGFMGGEEKKFGSSKVTYAEIPVLVRYDLCIPLAKDRRCELRLSPMAGFCAVGANYDKYEIRRTGYGYSYIDGNDSAAALAVGAGVGLAVHFTPRFSLDVGARCLSIDSADLKYTEIKSQTALVLSINFGCKF
ncbi:MAG: outer membrane beta-barrel protein [Opitutaceae bacterium]|nr:outer membrane beta-barrel protein [Opitutaceae bacterium]